MKIRVLFTLLLIPVMIFKMNSSAVAGMPVADERTRNNNAVRQPVINLQNLSSMEESRRWIIAYNPEVKNTLSFQKQTVPDSVYRKNLMPGIDIVEFDTVEGIASGLEKIQSDPSVLYIEPDIKRYLMSEPDDQYFNGQWGLQNIEAPGAWQQVEALQKTGVVACIDSGIDKNHFDLINRIAPGGKGFQDGSPLDEYQDTTGHGTAVAGVIAAESNNAAGIAGVAGTFDIKILPLKVFWGEDSAYLADVIAAIDYAIEKNVEVINLSLGSDQPSEAEEFAINRALDAGIVVVAAAGNEGTSAYHYPASYPGVISVGAIDQSNQKAEFSQYNDRVSLVAPGCDILITALNSLYAIGSGTSFSAPFVSGIAAFIKSVDPSLTGAEIKSIIQSSTDDLGVPGRDDQYGYGKANFNQALEQIIKRCGDVTGDGNIWPNDATAVLRYFVGLDQFDNSQLKAGDVTGDGNVWPDDAAAILRYYVGLDSQFEAENILTSTSF